jgi:ribonuclease BN (tRNA processing enzyme)
MKESTIGWSAHFLGVGARGFAAPASPAWVLERGGAPILLVDCGPDIPEAYEDRYGYLPTALFLTHGHYDHIGGLEALSFRLRFADLPAPLCRLFVPAPLVPVLQRRVADYPGTLAEGGANFWDVFQLIPVSTGFWHQELAFRVFPARHHLPDSAFGFSLPGVFWYSGDTRPIPEQAIAHASQGEVLMHDCRLDSNPSHSGVADLEREYPPCLRQRMWLYHYQEVGAVPRLEALGFRVVHPGTPVVLGAGGRLAQGTPPTGT